MKSRLTDFTLAALSGAATALGFPKFKLLFLIWISLIPLLFILGKRKPGASFLIGWTAGTFFYGILLYWIPAVPAHYGHLSSILSLAIYLVLILSLGLFWAIFGWLFCLIAGRHPKAAYFAAPFLWVSSEYAITHLFTGFPWGLLGLSQFENLSLIQISAITGVYGVSFVLVLFQSLFVYSLRFARRLFFAMAIVMMAVIHLAGFLSLKQTPQSPATFSAAAIQGNVSSDIYWNDVSTEDMQKLFEEHVDLTRRASATGARLIIWPEFTVPLCFSCNEEIYQSFKKTLSQFVRETGCTLLLGTNETSGPEAAKQYFNTALRLGPDLSITTYAKMHLVPFGEYTPYKKIFGFVNRVTHAIGDVTPGKAYVLHHFEAFRFGSPICYEIVFPNLVRRFTKAGANFLVTITNDGWYGKTSAPYQHFANAVLRAVENRKFVLRAATTGISGLIDPYGRILVQSEIGAKTFVTGDVTPAENLTFYVRFGDAFSFLCLTTGAVFLILNVFKRRP
jgi:apolipoprotein N-acyltransferase